MPQDVGQQLLASRMVQRAVRHGLAGQRQLHARRHSAG
jgi:hypothetical protein